MAVYLHYAHTFAHRVAQALKVPEVMVTEHKQFLMPEGRHHRGGGGRDGFSIPQLPCRRQVALEGRGKDELGPFPLCGPQVKKQLKAGPCKRGRSQREGYVSSGAHGGSYPPSASPGLQKERIT